ncbi:MAG: helix-turn-helix domain-containing protein [Acidimicrobiia bacterium]|nr:helix-turn-helix domain-containing protein [Acidimicrobiia bacterium]
MTLIDSPELAAMLKVPQRTLDTWAYLGKGPAYRKIGRHRRYRLDEVEAWLESQKHGGPDAPA